jgi:hypothetical protein
VLGNHLGEPVEYGFEAAVKRGVGRPDAPTRDVGEFLAVPVENAEASNA